MITLRNAMLGIVGTMFFIAPTYAEKQHDIPKETYEGFCTYLQGEYIAVGREAKTATPYQGKINIKCLENRKISVTRRINKSVVKAEGKIINITGHEKSEKTKTLNLGFKVTFTEQKTNYTIHYLVINDPSDNYARLSGVIYAKQGKKELLPGFEGLFANEGLLYGVRDGVSLDPK